MDSFLKIAHRGYSSNYPENTMPAFEQAAAAGADMIELDVRLSRDDRLVVIHDETIDRTSNGTGAVAELTLVELRQHNYNNGMMEVGWVEIPTLDDVIAWASDRVMLNIEIKNDPVRNGERGIEQRLAELLQKSRSTERIIVSSFDYSILAGFQKLAGTVRIGMLYDSVRDRFEDEVQTLGVYSVHPEINAVNPDQLRWAGSRGIRVYPWVVQDLEILKAYRASGYLDGAMVNDLSLFSFFEAEQPIRSPGRYPAYAFPTPPESIPDSRG